MMFSICHCWNKTPQEKGGSSHYQGLSRAITKNTKWKQFGTARSMQENQNQVIYQVSTIWSHGKDILKKKILGSWPWQYNTFRSCSASSTMKISTS